MFDEPLISACNLAGNIVSGCQSAEDINGTLFTSQLAARAEMVGGGGGDGGSNIRKFAMDSVNELICYCGYAPVGSTEDSAVWTITKIVTTVIGDADSTTTTNWKWTERETI